MTTEPERPSLAEFLEKRKPEPERPSLEDFLKQRERSGPIPIEETRPELRKRLLAPIEGEPEFNFGNLVGLFRHPSRILDALGRFQEQKVQPVAAATLYNLPFRGQGSFPREELAQRAEQLRAEGKSALDAQTQAYREQIGSGGISGIEQALLEAYVDPANVALIGASGRKALQAGLTRAGRLPGPEIVINTRGVGPGLQQRRAAEAAGAVRAEPPLSPGRAPGRAPSEPSGKPIPARPGRELAVREPELPPRPRLDAERRVGLVSEPGAAPPAPLALPEGRVGGAAGRGTPPPPREPPIVEGRVISVDGQPTPLSALPDMDDVVRQATQPDNFRAVANAPIVRTIVGRFNPAAVANAPIDQAAIGLASLQNQGRRSATIAFQEIARLGGSRRLFGATDDAGLLAEGPLAGRALNDIRTYPNRFALSPEQRTWVDQMDNLERAKLKMLQDEGIEVNLLRFEDGGQYAGRRVMSKAGASGEVLEVGYVGAGPSRLGGKLAVEQQRVFKTQAEGAAEGFQYLPEEDALFANLNGAYNRVAVKRTFDWMLQRIPWRTKVSPEAAKLGVQVTKQRLETADRLLGSINRAARGEEVPASTINSIKSAYPDQAGRLTELIEDVQIVRGAPGQAVPGVNVRPAQRVNALRAEAKGLVRAARREFASRRADSAAATRSARATAVETELPEIPALAGKVFSRTDAEALRNAFPRDLGTAFGGLDAFNDMYRFFRLGGDASPFGIQLLPYYASVITRPSQYLAATRVTAGYVRAIFDPQFHANLITKNRAFLEANPELLTTISGTEYTDWVRRAGWSRSKPFKILGKVYEPFQRGFEAQLDVAGIEMRKSLEHLVKDEASRRQVNAFVNEFRGLSDSAALGTTAGQRRLESRAMLAPRYNRAIASWFADMFHGNLRGSLAREYMGRFIAGLSAMSVAISFAKGESFDETVEHLKPWSREFMLWDTFGQRVGFGSKALSVARLIARSATDPGSLLASGMDNPGLRFVRGNLSGGAGFINDILQGNGYLGDPVFREDSLVFDPKWLLDYAPIPIWAHSVALEPGNLIGRAVRGPVEYFGGRAYPQSGSDMLRVAAPNVLQKEYNDAENWERRLLRAFLQKELAPVQEVERQRRALSRAFAESDKVKEQRMARLNKAVADWRVSGNKSSLVNDYFRAENIAKGAMSKVFDEFEFRERDPNDPVTRYFALMNQFRDPKTTDIDSQAFQQALPEFYASLTPDEGQYLLRNTEQDPIPAVILSVMAQSGGAGILRGMAMRMIASQQAREDDLNARGLSDLAALSRQLFFGVIEEEPNVPTR